MKTIGIIGLGKMGSAILGALYERPREGASCPYNIISSNGETNIEVAKLADVLILAVKPNAVPIVAAEIAGDIKTDAAVISIAAGVTLKKLEDLLGANRAIIRAMPNTPLLVGAGMTAICANKNTSQSQLDCVFQMFEKMGKCEIVPENQMDIITAISGSSPAYVYMFIDAMAEEAVRDGLSRDMAIKFASQAVLGAAKMVIETGDEPEKLKTDVCSPNGTTIEAVKTLEAQGFAKIIANAVDSAYERSKELGT